MSADATSLDHPVESHSLFSENSFDFMFYCVILAKDVAVCG